MATETTTVNLPLMHQVLEDLREHHVLESKFENRIRMTQTSDRWNPTGILSPYNTQQDYTHFGMSESGVLQSGDVNAYIRLKQSMRQLWKTVNITGELQRIKSAEYVRLKEEYGQETDDISLQGLATSTATEIYFKQASQVFKRLKNFYAIQGGSSSALGVITGLPGSNQLEFRWDTTDAGNRMFYKGQKVQFYDVSLSQLRRNANNYTTVRNESEQYSLITTQPDKRASVNTANNGMVQFDEIPTKNNSNAGAALVAGDTAHIIQGYGVMPEGFLRWISATNDLNGESGTVARSDYPEIFIPVVQANSPATANTPLLMAEMESFFKGRMSDEEAVNMEIWMNKTQVFRYIKFGLNSSTAAGSAFNVQRYADFNAPTNINVGMPQKGLSFNNFKIEEDVDVPPSKNLWIDWLGWMIDVETPEQIYEYHQNQQFYQSHNSYGEPIDAKQATMFTQYNYRCTKYKTNGYQDALAFDANQIAQS